MTIYFSDIVGFTDMSETMSPEQLVDQLRAYLGALNTKILDGGGTAPGWRAARSPKRSLARRRRPCLLS